ncbi:hypothetical protein JZ751_007417 [Albula glossodonta]|uniref:C2H2-type domain-containing protein n=1 Tax=Albula glossodonta TaxID=121402 RepID=A0A8T2N3U9_9TELE|nr:hypothetical protein JZ751_007417 [Albula glossodonta]
MDPDILKIEEVVMGEGTTDSATELASDGPAEPYTTIIIQEPQASSIVQPCESSRFPRSPCHYPSSDKAWNQHENLQCYQCFITFCNSKAKERHMKKSHREEYKQQLQQVWWCGRGDWWPSLPGPLVGVKLVKVVSLNVLLSGVSRCVLIAALSCSQCDTLFTCYVCDRTFPSSEELTQHQSTHNKEDKPFKCPHCQESFRTFSELTSHRRQVCPERQFVCRDCGETFRGPALLRTHRLAQHPPRPELDQDAGDDGTKTHRCGKCGSGFETEAELLQHQENHAGDRHCNGGGAPAKRRGRPPKAEEGAADAEKKGKRRKKGEGEGEGESGTSNHTEAVAPASAPAAAEGKVKGKRGRPAKSANPPSQDQSGAPAAEETKKKSPSAPPRQLPCPDCQLSFPSAAQLRAHKKEKHARPAPRKAHPCTECEESFARPEQLETHVARAHRADRHACPVCGKSFGRESNLKAHRQTHGQDQGPADGGQR